MESFFIAPSALPGGRAWNEVCSAFGETHAYSSQATDLAAAASEALRCDVSPTRGLLQVLLLLVVYGSVLFKASELIAHGSELLLLVPSLRGIVGSVVLPILGAVPDGAIVLFSGIGPNAQETVAVGVGALAGSTCMILTVPWFLSILEGRVNIRQDGVLTYHHRPHKLNPPGNMNPSRTGVQPMAMVAISGKMMLITATSYVVIQAAAISTGTFFAADQTAEGTQAAARMQKTPAVVCLVICLAFFSWYLYYQLVATKEEKEYREIVVDELKRKAILNGDISLTAAFKDIWSVAVSVDADESTGLIPSTHSRDRLTALLRTFFYAYDRDGSRTIDTLELQNLMMDLGEKCTSEEIEKLYADMDENSDGKIELEEFVSAMPRFIVARAKSRQGPQPSANPNLGEDSEANIGEDIDFDVEEEEEVPHDLRDEDPDSQIRKVKQRAFSMMAAGTVLVIIFSDPIVNVMSDFGERIGVPAFYISFVLAPLASNASEVLAAYTYALKKTRKTVTISFTTLLGAAILSNTFVLSIFMVLMTVQGLAWQFTAETITILFVEVVLGLMSQKKVLTLRDGYFSLAIFPLALLLVAFLENVVGLD